MVSHTLDCPWPSSAPDARPPSATRSARAATVLGMSGSIRDAGVLVVMMVLSAACGFDGFENLASNAACDPASRDFSIDIDNPFFPLPVGHQVVLEGEEGSTHLLVRITLAGRNRDRRRCRDAVRRNSSPKMGRSSRSPATSSPRQRMGPSVTSAKTSTSSTAEGTSLPLRRVEGGGGVRINPGIFMPPSLEVGVAFQQEIAPGIAEDQARVVAIGESTDVPAGTFDDTVTMEDGSPLDGGTRDEGLCPRIGLIVDGPARLTRYSPACPERSSRTSALRASYALATSRSDEPEPASTSLDSSCTRRPIPARPRSLGMLRERRDGALDPPADPPECQSTPFEASPMSARIACVRCEAVL